MEKEKQDEMEENLMKNLQKVTDFIHGIQTHLRRCARAIILSQGIYEDDVETEDEDEDEN